MNVQKVAQSLFSYGEFNICCVENDKNPYIFVIGTKDELLKLPVVDNKKWQGHLVIIQEVPALKQLMCNPTSAKNQFDAMEGFFPPSQF